MEEITNELYLTCIRGAVEVVEIMSMDQVNSAIMKFTDEEKRAILSQKVAKEAFESLTKKPEEEG